MPKYHILREAANGVYDEKGRFYPYRIAGDDVAGKAAIRYFVRSVALSSSQSGAVATSIDKVEVTIQGGVKVIAQNNIPATFAASNEGMVCQFEPRILTDFGSDINVTIASVAGFAIIQYAEVDEVVGDYAQ